MLLNFGKKFTEQWASVTPESMRKHWAEKLTGYSADELRTGLAACEMRIWPPTLPEFLQLCRPSIDPETAYREAGEGMFERKAGRMGKWSHPAVYWAAQKIGPFDVMNQPFKTMQNRWQHALIEQYALGDWKPVPEPMEALPEPGHTFITRKEADRRIKEIGLRVKKEPTAKDLSWANKIIDRIKAKDGTVSSAAARIAKDALGIA